jgi:hypothetical protein
MLRNSIYPGERDWNRSFWVKDHETGKRHRHARPASEWVRQQDEAWRIVSDDLWYAAQETRGRRNEQHLRDGRGRILRSAIGSGANRKRLLAGFLQCGECGGSFHALKPRMWGCSFHRNRGTCDNGIQIREAGLERAVLRAVKGALTDKVAAHALEVALDDLRKRIQAAEPRRLEAELMELDVKVERRSTWPSSWATRAPRSGSGYCETSGEGWLGSLPRCGSTCRPSRISRPACVRSSETSKRHSRRTLRGGGSPSADSSATSVSGCISMGGLKAPRSWPRKCYGPGG